MSVHSMGPSATKIIISLPRLSFRLETLLLDPYQLFSSLLTLSKFPSPLPSLYSYFSHDLVFLPPFPLYPHVTSHIPQTAFSFTPSLTAQQSDTPKPPFHIQSSFISTITVLILPLSPPSLQAHSRPLPPPRFLLQPSFHPPFGMLGTQ